MTHVIFIHQITESQGEFVFAVNIGKYKYSVIFTRDYWKQLTGERISPEELIKKSFEFLLGREGAESILPEFDLLLIGKYYPEYEETMKKSLQP